MSGGSLDYFYSRVTDTAERIQATCSEPLHQAFVSHLHKVSTALHDLEWMLSCDTSPGDEKAAIMAVISPADMLAPAIEAAVKAKTDLDSVMAEVGIIATLSERVKTLEREMHRLQEDHKLELADMKEELRESRR